MSVASERRLQIVHIFVVCSVGRCERIIKLFGSYQQICEVSKDKASSASGGGGKKKRGRQTKDTTVSGKDSSAAGKTSGGMFSIRFLSAALTALYRHDSFFVWFTGETSVCLSLLNGMFK